MILSAKKYIDRNIYGIMMQANKRTGKKCDKSKFG